MLCQKCCLIHFYKRQGRLEGPLFSLCQFVCETLSLTVMFLLHHIWAWRWKKARERRRMERYLAARPLSLSGGKLVQGDPTTLSYNFLGLPWALNLVGNHNTALIKKILHLNWRKKTNSRDLLRTGFSSSVCGIRSSIYLFFLDFEAHFGKKSIHRHTSPQATLQLYFLVSPWYHKKNITVRSIYIALPYHS